MIDLLGLLRNIEWRGNENSRDRCPSCSHLAYFRSLPGKTHAEECNLKKWIDVLEKAGDSVTEYAQETKTGLPFKIRIGKTELLKMDNGVE